jgi:hypothetical protein
LGTVIILAQEGCTVEKRGRVKERSGEGVTMTEKARWLVNRGPE